MGDFPDTRAPAHVTLRAFDGDGASGAEPAIMGLQHTHNGGCPMKIIVEIPEDCNALAEAIRNMAGWMSQEVRKARNLSRSIDFRALEDASAEHANALERAMLEGLLGAVAVDAEKIVVDGETYARAVEGMGQYHGLAGTVNVRRWLYRKTTERNGPTFDPVAARVGALEGGWLRSTAEAMARVLQEMPTRPAQALAKVIKRLPYSRTSFEHVGHLVGARVVAALPEVEDGAGRMLVAALDDRVKSVSFAVDRVAIPMEESKPRPVGRPKKGAPKKPVDRVFRMAYCGVVTLHDDKGEALHSHRYGRMPSDDATEMMLGMGEDLSALLQTRPDLQVVALADGAHEMWTLIDVATGVIEADHGHTPRRHVDFWHLVEKLTPAATAIYGEEAGTRIMARWRARLLNHQGAASQIRQELLASGRSTGRPGNPVHEAITYLTNHGDRFGYAAARADGLPIGSGAVEATCKTVVSVRMKRSGARWKDETGRHVLLLRVLAQSDAWPVVQKVALRHHAPNISPLRQAA
jgi:hypothetical protein